MQIYVDESADCDDDSNALASQSADCEGQALEGVHQDLQGANFPTKENSKDFYGVEHIVVELEDPEFPETMLESERIEHAEFPEGNVGEGLFSNTVEFKESLGEVDRLESSPSPHKFGETLNIDHQQLNLSQLQPKDECETPEPTPHFQSSARQDSHPEEGMSSRLSH